MTDGVTDNVVRFPYVVKPRRFVEKLVESGWLPANQRHNAEAVEAAVARLRAYSERWFHDRSGSV